MVEYKKLSRKETELFEKWLRHRTSVVRNRAEVDRCRIMIAMAAHYRECVNPKSKNGAMLLSWMAIQEAKAYRRLRLLPGALRYSRYQVKSALKELLGE